MSLELVNTFATVGTFVVIAATATAAIVQLRHMRGSNQFAALSALFDRQSSPEYVSALQFVFTELPQKMRDPAFRYQVVHRASRTKENAAFVRNAATVGGYYEEMGLLAKNGLIDRDLLCDMHRLTITQAWDALVELTALARDHYGPALYENFEYVTVIAQDWLAKPPSGTYPANVRRIDLPNKWREADLAYAASFAT
jgi:hypothetical protein